MHRKAINVKWSFLRHVILASSGTGTSDMCFEKQESLATIINKFKCKTAMLYSLTKKTALSPPFSSHSSKVMINSLICIFFQGSVEYIRVK